MFIKPVPALVALLLLSSSWLLGQANEDTYVNIDFQAVAWAKVDGKAIKYFNGSDVVSLSDLSDRRRGQAYSYRGPRKLQFFNENYDADGKLIRVPVGIVEVPVDTKRLLFLFIPIESELRFGIMSFDDEPGTFPFGSFRFLNMSDMSLACRAGDDRFFLPARQEYTVTREMISDKVLGVHIKAESPDGWESIQNTIFSYRPDARVMVFITDVSQGNSRKLKYKSFIENERQYARSLQDKPSGT